MNFLDIVRWAVRESGTVGAPGSPSSVVGQQGRLARFVQWSADAYDAIQIDRGDWRWLEDTFDGDLQPGLSIYDAGALGIVRFRRWHRVTNGESTVSLTDPALPTQQPAMLAFYDWPTFYTQCRVGPSFGQIGRPQIFTIDPRDRIQLHPTPDKVYGLQGLYVRSPQRLTANGDIPEMPEHFHRIIPQRALMMMSTFDEAFAQKPHFGAEYSALYKQLLREQVDTPRLGGPLA